VYENSLSPGSSFGDRQMGPIRGYVSTGEISTQFALWIELLTNGDLVSDALISRVYSVLYESAPAGSTST
jgi:hypothetical protein